MRPVLTSDVPVSLNSYVEGKIAIITDNTVRRLYGTSLLNSLRRLGRRVNIYSFEPGERSKNRDTKAWIEDKLIADGHDRDSTIVALGGGVVGDLAGFVAATYFRGVPLIQIPTTLLAMVDSSIGGKNGVNTDHAKNLIGSFHMPICILCDINYLDTLPREELKNGLAEMIKTAAVADGDFFALLERDAKKVLDLDKSTLKKHILACSKIKSKIVERDAKDHGTRNILNFGHTVGHAIESYSKYSVSHGDAISLGMVVEARMSETIGFRDTIRLSSLLQGSGLRTSLRIDSKSLVRIMGYDKKNIDGRPSFILLKEIGCALESPKEIEDIERYLEVIS